MFEHLKKELSLESRNFFTNSTNLENEDFFDDFFKFNDKIGLPKHPFTGKPTNLIPYQSEFFKLVDEKKRQKFHITKSRQIGVTELILRVIAFHCFHKYKGGKVLIIAGTREKTAAKLMNRFKDLFKKIPHTVEDSKHVLSIRLTNGTEIEALPSNSDAVRGDTKIKAIFVDEAAHFDLKDDSVVLNAIQPIVFSNRSDLYLVSTPRGPRGFFYKIWKDGKDYKKLEYDYSCAVNHIYSKEEAEEELKRVDVDVDQEYRCKFTAGRNAIFTINESAEEDYVAENYDDLLRNDS